MSQNNTISVKAKNIVDNFINKNWSRSNSISRTDVMKHVIVTLYAQIPNAKAELIQPFKDCIFDLSEHFTQEEIELICNEASAIIRYCYEFADVMGHIDFDDDSELVEEIVANDPPYSIYKTPKSLIELCMRLSGRPKENEKVFMPYGDIADYALYNPNAEYKMECEGYPAEKNEIYISNRVNSYCQLLLDSQGVKSETIYDDCSSDCVLSHLSTQADYIFAFNPTLNQSQHKTLYICDGMWANPQKVTSYDLVQTIAYCSAFIKSGKCLDFVLPIDYLKDKEFWYIFEVLLRMKKSVFSTMIISLPSMEFGDSYVKTFLLHIEKDRGQGGMIRLIDATSAEFSINNGFTETGKNSLFNFDTRKEMFSITNPNHYQRRGINVDFLMEVIDAKECNAKYEDCIDCTHIEGEVDYIAFKYFIDKKLPKLSEGEKYIPVGELVDVIESINYESLLSDPSLNWKESVYGPIRGTYVQGERLSGDYLNCDINLKNDICSAFCIGKKIVKSPCLVIGTTATGALTFGKTKVKDKYIVVDEDVVALKLKGNAITEDYLLRELTKDYCTMQVLLLSDTDDSEGAKFFNTKNIVDVKIAVPSLEEQERRCKEDVHRILEETRKNLNEADRQLLQSAEEFKRDVHMKKHAIGQTLFNLSNWWDLLQKARKEGNGIVDDSQEVGKKRKTKVVDIYSNIQMALEKLQMQVDSFWRADGLQVESVSLTTFVKEYIKEHQSPLFVYEYDSISTLANNNVPKVAFSKQALMMVFDNIINNACSHGFENKASESNIVKIEVQMDNGLPYIVISNNGNSVHEKISSEDVFTYGRFSKSGQAHYGIGGYEVRNLMRVFQGEAEFISTPQEDFPVSYKLSFRKVSNNV